MLKKLKVIYLSPLFTLINSNIHDFFQLNIYDLFIQNFDLEIIIGVEQKKRKEKIEKGYF